MLSILKFFGAPGSITFLALSVGVGLLAYRFLPRHRRLARTWLAMILALYLLFALPWIALRIDDALPPATPVDRTMWRPLDTLIVFDGDNRVARARMAADVVGMANPGRIWVLGDKWLAERMDKAGVPRSRVTLDSSSPTTRAQMAWVSRFLVDHPRERTGVIASRIQMPRIEALARTDKMPLVLIASPFDAEPARSGLLHYLPSYAALRVSRDAFYEHVALAYYDWRGFTRSTPHQ